MAEDGREVATADTPYAGSISNLWSDYSDDSKCPYCGINKVLAESRLHRGWLNERVYLVSNNRPVEAFRAGSTLGCNVCALVVDALTMCRPEGIQGLETAKDFTLWIQKENSHYTLEMRSRDQYLSVFMVEGMNAHPAQLYLVVRMLGMRLNCTADQHMDIDSKSMWNLPTLPHPSGDTSSLQAVNTIKRWISTCRKEHKHCRNHDQSYQNPKRLLKLSTASVQLREDIDPDCKYACLSHCWGLKGPALRLGSDTTTELRAGIPVDRLPKTFRDAVVLCLNLGIQYLWIDALCILQDNNDDWEEAAATMADVYAGAIITIAATWSGDSSHGCFSQMRTELEDRPLQELGVFVRVIKPRFPRIPWHSSATERLWPLLDRAWVYQERKLSARVVHLAKEQLYWECDFTFLSEDGSEDLRELYDLDLKSSIEDPAVAWRVAVQHYSRLKLTHESDRLPAISALVKRMQPLREGDIYIAGSWLNTILADIAWCTVVPGGKLLPRHENTCPTWSWVAVPHGVVWDSGNILLPSVRLLDMTYNIIGPTHFGQTTDASIRVEGPTMAAKYTGNENALWLTNMYEPSEYLEGRSVFVIPDFDFKSAGPPILSGEIFDILLMDVDDRNDCGGMMLRRTAEEQRQRIGWIELWSKDIARPDNHPEWTQEQVVEDFIASLPIKQFTIV